MGTQSRSLVRVVPRAAASEWLLAWAQAGWLPASSPTVVGATDDGDDVLEVVLAATPDVRGEPLTPYLQGWRPTA